MLVEIYIEAILADANLADQVWELWNEGVITDDLAAWAWFQIAIGEPIRCYGSDIAGKPTDSRIDSLDRAKFMCQN